MNQVQEILKAIESHNKIIILRHVLPDGDAYGFQFGLKNIIKLCFSNFCYYWFIYTTFRSFWTFSLFYFAKISVIFGIIVILLIKDNPEAAGLPSLQKYYNLQLIGENKTIVKKTEEDKSWRYYFVNYVLKNKFVWFLVISNMLIYTLRIGISNWLLTYLKTVHGYDIKSQGKWIYSMFDWGGVLTTLTIGLLANKFLRRFAPIAMIVILVATLSVVGIWLANTSSIAMLAIVIFLPQCFLPIMVSEFSHHRVISTSAGILGISGYLGDALMSKVIIGFGLINVSWDAVFIFLIVCGVIGAVILLPMFKKQATH